jgi:hypothetical protein
MWDKIKAFFKRSSVIFYSRLQALAGFLLAVLGSMDWSQIRTWDFTTPKQTAWLGIGLIVNGVITEVLRRRGPMAQA